MKRRWCLRPDPGSASLGVGVPHPFSCGQSALLPLPQPIVGVATPSLRRTRNRRWRVSFGRWRTSGCRLAGRPPAVSPGVRRAGSSESGTASRPRIAGLRCRRLGIQQSALAHRSAHRNALTAGSPRRVDRQEPTPSRAQVQPGLHHTGRRRSWLPFNSERALRVQRRPLTSVDADARRRTPHP